MIPATLRAVFSEQIQEDEDFFFFFFFFDKEDEDEDKDVVLKNWVSDICFWG